MAEVDTRSKPTNGKQRPPPDGWERWLGSAAAAKRLQCSLSTLTTLVSEGHLACYDAPDGTKRFNQQSLTDFEDAAGTLFEEDQLGGAAADKKASREGIPAEAIRATAELLKASQKQNLELHTLVIQGFKAASDAQQETIRSQQLQLNHYHQLIDQVLVERENMLDARLEREALRENYQAVQKRRTELFEQSKTWATDLVAILKQRLSTMPIGGTTNAPDERLNAALELLKTIDPRQLEVLATMGFFNPTQIGYLERILGRKLSEEPKASAPKTSPEPSAATNGGSGTAQPNPTAATAAQESETTNA